MTGSRSGMTEVALPPGVRGEHIETLQARVAGNRWRFAAFTTAYVVAVASSISATILLLFILIPLIARSPSFVLVVLGAFPAVAKATVAASVLAVGAWAAVALARSERSILARLEARVPRPGELKETRSALKDMSLAAGFEHAPPLYVIETDRVNAFVIGRSPARTVVGVTRGFSEKLSVADQRAVFANLMARVLSGDALWATAVSALAGPVWALRDSGLPRENRTEASWTQACQSMRSDVAHQMGPPLLGWWVFLTFVVVLTEVLAYWHREVAWRAAEKADAEGMLLLRDPGEMLAALERVLDRNNHVPTAGDAYSLLFYCWSGFGFAPEYDPQARRVARLREVLGVEGLAPRPSPNLPGWPQAPRVADVPVGASFTLAEPVSMPVGSGPDGRRVLAVATLASALPLDIGLVAWRSGDADALRIAWLVAAAVAAWGVAWGVRQVAAQGSGGREARAMSSLAFAGLLVLTLGSGIVLLPVWIVASLAGASWGEALSREAWRRRFLRRYSDQVAEADASPTRMSSQEQAQPAAVRISVRCTHCGARNAPVNRRCTVCGKKLKP
ncbi:MAG: M48 family metalloprotease [Coriobacteriia bacterium]|nr:M48 family metalloprotease [Coriobacteriia bacterium]